MGNLKRYVEDAGDEDRVVIELPPEFSGDALEEFERMTDEIASQGGTPIRIDCRRLSRINSEGFGLLVIAYARGLRLGKRVVFEPLSSHCRSVFRLVGFPPEGDDGGELSAQPARLSPVPPSRLGQAFKTKPNPDQGEEST